MRSTLLPVPMASPWCADVAETSQGVPAALPSSRMGAQHHSRMRAIAAHPAGPSENHCDAWKLRGDSQAISVLLGHSSAPSIALLCHCTFEPPVPLPCKWQCSTVQHYCRAAKMSALTSCSVQAVREHSAARSLASRRSHSSYSSLAQRKLEQRVAAARRSAGSRQRRLAAASATEQQAAAPSETSSSSNVAAALAGLRYASPDGAFLVRPMDKGNPAEVRRIVSLQTEAFHTPARLQLLDGMARQFFEAEVLSGERLVPFLHTHLQVAGNSVDARSEWKQRRHHTLPISSTSSHHTRQHLSRDAEEAALQPRRPVCQPRGGTHAPGSWQQRQQHHRCGNVTGGVQDVCIGCALGPSKRALA